MILFVGIHMIRVYLMAAYKYPREMSWISGLVLLGLTLGMGFTGQLLRWDSNGIWSAVVGAEQAGRIPIIGKLLAHFLLGGETVLDVAYDSYVAADVPDKYEAGLQDWAADASLPMDRLANYEKLVYPGWVRQFISEGEPGLFEVSHEGFEAYQAGHIPGAVHFDLGAIEIF